MRQWIRCFGIALCVECPLFALLIFASPKSVPISKTSLLFVWIHIVPLSLVSFVWLKLFGHGEPEAGGVWVWYLGYWAFVLITQTLLITLLLVGLLAMRNRFRGLRKLQP
jgi:hypothetical protein